MENHFSINKESELPVVVEAVRDNLSRINTIILNGDLGAGKTTLVQYLLRELGCNDIVQSPTFGKIHEYKAAEYLVFHMDFYREAALNLELDEILMTSNSISCIEWFDLGPISLEDLLSSGINVLQLNIKNLGGESREIEIKKL